jgi:hypothetical protein
MPASPPPPAPAAASVAGAVSLSRPWFRRYPVATFLAALIVSFASAPFDELFQDGDLIEAARLTVILVPALWAVGGGRRQAAWGLVLAVPALAGKWLNHFHPNLVPAVAYLAPALLFILLVILHLLRFILRARRIDSEVLCAGMATYLLLGLVWAFAYILVARLDPGAFAFTAGPAASQTMKGLTALYYSFITLSTVGYGDILPVSDLARMLAMMEAITGTLYVATLIARLVSLYSSAAPSDQARTPAPILSATAANEDHRKP